MEDLAGLDWTSSSSQTSPQPQVTSSSTYFPTLRPTPPISGRSTPAAIPTIATLNKSGLNSPIPSKSSTPANDSFASLVSFNASQNKNFTLQERQKALEEQREKQNLDSRRQLGSGLGPRDVEFWNQLGDGRSTPGRVTSPPTYTGTDEYGGRRLSSAINKPFAAISAPIPSAPSRRLSESEDDLLAAFSADAPVDKSSNFPVPSQSRATSTIQHASLDAAPVGQKDDDIDNDPFGFGAMAPIRATQPSQPHLEKEDDDILGLLGRPLSEVSITRARNSVTTNSAASATSSPVDKAIAELVDMGFPADKSKAALETTDSGVDVQSAVGWLLNQAHEESKQKHHVQHPELRNSGQSPDRPSRRKASPTNDVGENGPIPAWMRQQSRSNLTQRRQDSRSPALTDKDAAKYATELGNNIFKTANSLWKNSTKKINQAVSEFNSSESDLTQPKWMREAQHSRPPRKPSPSPQAVDRLEGRGPPHTTARRSGESNITDEALMLESRDTNSRPRQRAQQVMATSVTSSGPGQRSSESQLDASHRKVNAEPLQNQVIEQSSTEKPRSIISRMAVEEQSSQAYQSPARRKRPTPRQPSPEPNLLLDASTGPVISSRQPTPVSQARTPIPNTLPSRPRSPPPVRKIPPMSSIALQASTSHRNAGTNAFKVGNYAEAKTFYTSSLSSVPPEHPLAILLLTNRALTQLKTGDPKACIADADKALMLIGPSKGHGETIDAGHGEGNKDVVSFWGKAMTRKAEALEQLERWNDAAKIWRECVEAGVGGGTSIQGRNRCEKAVGIQSAPNGSALKKAPLAARKIPSKTIPKASAHDDLSGQRDASVPQSGEAVNRLRAANAKAERVDDEKFALADSVDERLSNWRKGKEGNLRALLGSLDMVLWEGSGWKKIGMSELILPGKVKVNYMKGISKVHPDKVCQS